MKSVNNVEATPEHDNSRMVMAIKWIGTVLLLISGGLSTLGYMPLNFIAGAVGCIFWCTIGFIWKDKSIMLLNFTLGLLYCTSTITFWPGMFG